MDWTESQLRYGSVLNKIGESSTKEGKESKRSKSRTPKSHDFLTYALSLLRQGSSDHADMLPSVDISSLKVFFRSYLNIGLVNSRYVLVRIAFDTNEF